MSKHLFYDLHDDTVFQSFFLIRARELATVIIAILFAVHWPTNQKNLRFSTGYLLNFSLGKTSTTKNDEKRKQRQILSHY